jgi:hypothetical protein
LLFHQEFPERLLLTYKPEESEEIPEPVSAEEEKPQIEEPAVAVPSTEVVPPPPPKPEVVDTGDLLVSRRNHLLHAALVHLSQFNDMYAPRD